MDRRKFVQTAFASPLLFSFAGLQSRGEAAMAPAIVPPDDAFMATLPRLMELAQLPGVGIGVVQGDRLIWQHYAGVANAATKAPITVDSLFPAASMGKPVFAYAAAAG